MTPNPVCYNGVNLPTKAVHLGKVSIGINPKDYRADTAQRWRSGISPSGAIVAYSDTYSLGIQPTQALSEPRIWWIQPSSPNVGDRETAIIELLSRLPERAANNYQLFPTYNDAINWLLALNGKYSLLNDNYPEYSIPADSCLFNVDANFLPSFMGDSVIRNLSNPNLTSGSSLNAYALSYKGFTLSNFDALISAGGIGDGTGISLGATGHAASIDNVVRNAFTDNYMIFEGVFEIDYNANGTVFCMIDPGTGNEVFRLDWDANVSSFNAHYPMNGTVVEFEPTTPSWSQKIHLVVHVPATDSGSANARENSKVFVNGVSFNATTISGTSGFVWSSSASIQLGNNKLLNSGISKIHMARLNVVNYSSSLSAATEIASTNWGIIQPLYNIL